MDELLKELVSNGNAVGPDGIHLFSGTKSFTEPFEIVFGNSDHSDEPLITELRYNGSVGTKNIEIDNQAYLPTGKAETALFGPRFKVFFQKLTQEITWFPQTLLSKLTV